MLRSRFAGLALLAVACGAGFVPLAGHGIDWAAVADVGVPELVSHDADGAERVTKLWLVVVDGEGFVRTGETRWAGNLERDPQLELRVLGEAHPLRAVAVSDLPLRGRVHAAFRAKYGWQDRMLGLFAGEDDAKIFRLAARDAATGP